MCNQFLKWNIFSFERPKHQGIHHFCFCSSFIFILSIFHIWTKMKPHFLQRKKKGIKSSRLVWIQSIFPFWIITQILYYSSQLNFSIHRIVDLCGFFGFSNQWICVIWYMDIGRWTFMWIIDANKYKRLLNGYLQFCSRCYC